MKETFGEIIVRHLEAEGVEYAFGVPGTTIVPLLSALGNSSSLRPILAKHEAGAAFMADGYARVKGTIGACFSTAGPGATNLLTGVATSHLDDVPVLVLTGQVDTNQSGKGAFQDSSRDGVDTVKMFEPITRRSSMVTSKYRAVDELQAALRVALTGRKGPVHLSIPRDICADYVDYDGVRPSTYRFAAEYFDRRLVIEAAEKLVNADHPAILIGSGAVSSGACDEIRELAEMLSIPVATTPKAKGAFPEDHPLALGVLGLCGSPLAERYMKSGEVDVLLVIGASLNQITTLSWDDRLVPGDSLIHINIDPAEIGKVYPTQVPLVGDARTVVSEINFRLLRYVAKNESGWDHRITALDALRKRTGMYLEPEKLRATDIPLKPQRLMAELQSAMPDDAILFIDVGNSIPWAVHYLNIKTPGALITPFGLLTMGYGISAAIGGKLAAPKRPVIAVAGDGCFAMNGMEIATAVDNNVPVVFIIVRNNKLGLVHDLQTFTLGDKTVATRFRPIDAAKVAEGLGATSFRADNPGDLARILPEAIRMDRVVVIDCAIDPNEMPPLAPFIEGARDFGRRLNFG